MLRSFFLKTLDKYASRWLALGIDVILVCFSFLLSYIIRFNITFNFNTDQLILQVPVIIVVALSSFLMVGSYKGIVRHTGTKDAFNVFLGVSLLFLTAISIVLINNLFAFIPRFTIPLSILIIHYLISILALVISRYVFKAFFKMISTKLSKSSNVLIYGSGDSGLATYEALDRDTKHQYNVLGFIDDNEKKSGKKINQVKIYNRKIYI